MPARLIALAVATGAVGPIANPPAPRGEPGPPITCRFAPAASADDLTLTAIAQPTGALQARYRLSVIKRDAAGQSINIQSGAVATKPGKPQILATVTMPASANGHVEADLQITWDRGQTSCSFP